LVPGAGKNLNRIKYARVAAITEGLDALVDIVFRWQNSTG